MKTGVNPWRVLAKALTLFVVINLIYAWINPSLSAISAYNTILPGRTRFPFGSAANPYVVMVDNLDVMAASHVISAPKQPGEYRVVLIGDSSVWGERVAASDTLSEQWNRLNDQCGDRQIKFYNLGYPHPSVIKDLIILDKAMEYQPDLILWFVTLNTMIPRRLSPFIAANGERATNVLAGPEISISQEEELAMQKPSFYERTLFGRRSDLSRWVKLQALGLLWTATGLDKRTPAKSPDLSPNVDDNKIYRGWKPGTNLSKKMLFSALEKGQILAKSTPVLIMNEPIFIATGRNSNISYNVAYPRWAYDQYREAMTAQAQKSGFHYLDLWNAIPVNKFADNSLHLSSAGERLLITQIDPWIRHYACP